MSKRRASHVGEPLGVVCPECRTRNSHVLSKREGRGYIRRRHACNGDGCRARNVRWTTYEFFSPRRGVIAVPRDTRAIRSASTSDSQT
jgi:transcriptional regulator NrdR family protein